MTRIFFVCIFILLIQNFLAGQSPYRLTVKKEVPILLAGGAITGLSLYANSRQAIFTTDEIVTLDVKDINGFDRWATRQNSHTADHISDILMFTGILSPLLVSGNEQVRKDYLKIGLMYVEAAALTGSLTSLGKSVFSRGRPYVFNPDMEDLDKTSKSARRSFPSGHTSITAMGCFFTAKIFADYYPDSKLKPYVWTAAAIVPATTGLMRVMAGKHFPTDVMTGYIAGASIGFLIPHLHKIQDPDSALQFDVGMGSVQMVWYIGR